MITSVAPQVTAALTASTGLPEASRLQGAYGYVRFANPQQDLSISAFTPAIGKGVNDLRDVAYVISAAGREAL